MKPWHDAVRLLVLPVSGGVIVRIDAYRDTDRPRVFAHPQERLRPLPTDSARR